MDKYSTWRSKCFIVISPKEEIERAIKKIGKRRGGRKGRIRRGRKHRTQHSDYSIKILALIQPINESIESFNSGSRL